MRGCDQGKFRAGDGNPGGVSIWKILKTKGLTRPHGWRVDGEKSEDQALAVPSHRGQGKGC